jgi:Spy/CpxP family protein refolding chaperone
MNKIWKVLGIVGLVALVFGVTSLVYAQTESTPPDENYGYGSGMMGGRGYHHGGTVDGEYGPYHDLMVESFADALGLTEEQVEERLASGEMMWQIAEAEGSTWDEFIEIMQAARTAMLEQAVNNGLLTQEQADLMQTRGMFRGLGMGFGGCTGFGFGNQSGLQRGPQGRWNAP